MILRQQRNSFFSKPKTIEFLISIFDCKFFHKLWTYIRTFKNVLSALGFVKEFDYLRIKMFHSMNFLYSLEFLPYGWIIELDCIVYNLQVFYLCLPFKTNNVKLWMLYEVIAIGQKPTWIWIWFQGLTVSWNISIKRLFVCMYLKYFVNRKNHESSNAIS